MAGVMVLILKYEVGMRELVWSGMRLLGEQGHRRVVLFRSCEKLGI